MAQTCPICGGPVGEGHRGTWDAWDSRYFAYCRNISGCGWQEPDDLEAHKSQVIDRLARERAPRASMRQRAQDRDRERDYPVLGSNPAHSAKKINHVLADDSICPICSGSGWIGSEPCQCGGE